jgi:F420-dependent oxidoreductase-like protein
MRVGLQLPTFTWPGGEAEIAARLADIARTAEEAGFASLWVMDHYFPLPGWGKVADEPMLECYTTLGYLSAITSRVQLGPLVTGVVYRHPALLVKAASTFDVLCGGRSYFGVGSAWYREEAEALGMRWPPRAERYALLEDTLRLAHQMFAGDAAPFSGTHIHAPAPHNRPLPVSRPRPRIMVGGNGERKTLRLVAEYGDACNFLVLEPDEVRRKVDVLKRHCDAVGRPVEEIEITALNEVDLRPGQMTAADVVHMLRDLRAAGVQHAIVNLPNAHEIAPLEILGREVIAAVAR